MLSSAEETTELHQQKSYHQRHNLGKTGQHNFFSNLLLGIGLFCPVREESCLRRNDDHGSKSFVFFLKEEKTDSMAKEPVLYYTQSEVDEMISVAVANASKASEVILTESTRLELEELTKMYEDTRNQYGEEIHRMQQQMESLSVNALISAAAEEVRKASNENLEKARQESQKLLEIYEEQKHQYTEKISTLRANLEQIAYGYDELNQNISELSSSARPGLQENEDSKINFLLKRIGDMMAHQCNQNTEKDKLITFLSTKLVDAEAVITKLEENNESLERRLDSMGTTKSAPATTTNKKVTFSEEKPEEIGCEVKSQQQSETATMWFW